MYLAINPIQFDIHYVMLSDKTKNNVMENGRFLQSSIIRIIYAIQMDYTYILLYKMLLLKNILIK